jgi:hypothetical protein
MPASGNKNPPNSRCAAPGNRARIQAGTAATAAGSSTISQCRAQKELYRPDSDSRKDSAMNAMDWANAATGAVAGQAKTIRHS